MIECATEGVIALMDGNSHPEKVGGENGENQSPQAWDQLKSSPMIRVIEADLRLVRIVLGNEQSRWGKQD